MILYGPPGTGKTTLARIVAHATGAAFEELSAVNAGKADVTAVIARARERLGQHGRRTILFLDEIHRFNKAQQDALLPVVESGLVTLIGATTENPYFEVNPALLSRCALYELEPLETGDLRAILERGAADLDVTLGADAADELARGGDARSALAALELATATAHSRGVDAPGRSRTCGPPCATPCATTATATCTTTPSRRSSSPCAAPTRTPRSTGSRSCWRAARTRSSWRGAWSSSPRRTSATPIRARSRSPINVAMAVDFVGLPEGRICLAQGVTYLALAPKSNASYVAIDEALGEVRRNGSRIPPAAPAQRGLPRRREARPRRRLPLPARRGRRRPAASATCPRGWRTRATTSRRRSASRRGCARCWPAWRVARRSRAGAGGADGLGVVAAALPNAVGGGRHRRQL